MYDSRTLKCKVLYLDSTLLDIVSQFSTTTITIPLTTNQRRASLPVCMLIKQGDGGLSQDSVALCFQIRVLDKRRLIRRLGQLSTEIITQLEQVVLVTLGYEV
ncbi:type II toxin-antitoxin system PemK/MazF family toxin [Trichothermofontia sp.]